jgi:excisionase family DNA binding protein
MKADFAICADDISLISRYLMEPQAVSALFVRIPTADAERLDRASFESGRPKQELVAEALRTLEVPRPPVGFARPSPASDDVLTTAQLADLLKVDEATVQKLARGGELPGRKVGRDWRFSRAAILDWLAGSS